MGKGIEVIQQLLARMRYRRWRRQVRDRIVIGILLGFVVLNFCLCFWLGLVTTVLQQIGILPTPTPSLPLENQTQGSASPKSLQMESHVNQIEVGCTNLLLTPLFANL